MKSAPEVDVDTFINDDFLDYANDFDRDRWSRMQPSTRAERSGTQTSP